MKYNLVAGDIALLSQKWNLKQDKLHLVGEGKGVLTTIRSKYSWGEKNEYENKSSKW